MFTAMKSLVCIVACFLAIAIDGQEQFSLAAEISPLRGDNSQLFYPMSQVTATELELLPGSDITPKLRRRVSGFVPMRGKKDNSLPLNYIEQAPRELDSDATLSRLANPMDLQQQQQEQSRMDSMQSTANNNWQPVVAVPRQFFYQMTNHRQDQQEPAAANNNWQASSGANGLGWGQQATNSMLMEAKLRRAFHPMRGKRANVASPSILFSED